MVGVTTILLLFNQKRRTEVIIIVAGFLIGIFIEGFFLAFLYNPLCDLLKAIE
jgi:hypothetical protein